MISIVLKVEAWESEGAAASPSPTKISSSGVGGDSVTTPNPLPKSKPTGNNMDPELTSEGDGRDTNGDANGDAGEGLEREEGDSTSNDDLATSFSSQQQSESLERAEKVFKVGWFEGTESMEVKVGIRDAAERHLGVQGIVWRLVGEGGEDLVVSSKLPEGTYRFQWKRRACALGSGVRRLGADLQTLTPNRRKKSLSEAQELMDEVVEKVMETNENNIILVLLNFSLAFIAVITVFTKIHTALPSFLSTCIGPNSHSKAKALYSCMRTHIGKNNNTDHAANLYGCAVQGDVGGVLASVCHWFRVEHYDTNLFLFGFSTQADLQVVVYESMISSICWGVSYLWIRRGMNPETRKGYYSKYWKDAVYGSLAGFNGAFMKGVLKQAIKNARS